MSWRCFLLWHHWRPQAAKQVALYRNQVARNLNFPTKHQTEVLMRCTRCSRFKVKKLCGYWTLEQLVLGEEMHDSPQPKVRA